MGEYFDKSEFFCYFAVGIIRDAEVTYFLLIPVFTSLNLLSCYKSIAKILKVLKISK